MRATLRSTVVPSLSRHAHSRATPAFLLDFTSIEPLSSVPPCTRRWLGPDEPTLTRPESSALPIRATISRVRFCEPFSIRFTALWLLPSDSASWACVLLARMRASRIMVPMRFR